MRAHGTPALLLLVLTPVLALVLAPGSALAADDATRGITFNKEVVRIFQQHCQTCHRPGQIAPMSLLTYAEARPWAKSIRKEVVARAMPPWHAEGRPGEFANDMSLSQEEIDTIVDWVDGGARRGDPAELPPPVEWSAGEWELGEPDYVFSPQEAFVVPPTARDEDLYQCIVFPTQLEEDVWVEAFEYKVGNPEIVHHLVAFADTTGRAVRKDTETPGQGFPCGMGREEGIGAVAGLDAMLGGWGPGVPPNVSHSGTARLLKKGSHIFFQMHYYNPGDAEQLDLTKVGVYLAKKPVKAKSRVMAIIAPPMNFQIPAGAPDARHFGKWNVPSDIFVYSLAPHMHYLGKAMTLTAQFPDGSSDTLLSVPRYNFNWQRTYHLAEPRLLPAGTIVEMTSVHDNTTENPLNPSDPPIDVKWGESTTEEMAIGFLGYWKADEDLR